MVKIKVSKKVKAYKRRINGRKRKVKVHTQTYFVDRDQHTIYVQKPSGLLAGRKRVRGSGDKTAVIRSRSTGRIFGRSRPLTSNVKTIKVNIGKISRNVKVENVKRI